MRNNLILKPIISEKSMLLATRGTYMFEVPKNAEKISIAMQVERMFKVSVTDVNTTILKGKVKRFKGVTGVRKDIKRAFVTVKKGDKIAIFEESK